MGYILRPRFALRSKRLLYLQCQNQSHGRHVGIIVECKNGLFVESIKLRRLCSTSRDLPSWSVGARRRIWLSSLLASSFASLVFRFGPSNFLWEKRNKYGWAIPPSWIVERSSACVVKPNARANAPSSIIGRITATKFRDKRKGDTPGTIPKAVCLGGRLKFFT